MTFPSPLDFLTKGELLWLLKQYGNVDNRDIANCRYEMANAHATALHIEADRLEALEVDAILVLAKKPGDGKLREIQLKASVAALYARRAANRARKTADARWRDLMKFHLPARVK